MRLLRVLMVVLLVIAMAGTASAATYYVATTGTNATCVAAQTITTPAQTIAFGVGCLSAGDTLYIRTGTYAERIDSNDYTIPSGASWVAAITIAGYPNESVTISNGINIQANIDASIPQYLIFDNLTIRNNTGNAFRVAGGVHHIRLQRSDILSGRESNIFVHSTTSFIEILNNVSHDAPIDTVNFAPVTVGSYGIYMQGNNSLIEGNIFSNNTGYAIHHYLSGGDTVSDNIIRNNIMYGNGRDDGTRNDSLSAMIVASGGDNLIYNNVIYDNKSGINNTTTDPGTNNQFYNNTVYDNDVYGIEINTNTTSTKVQNNILYANGGGTAGEQLVDWGATTPTIDHNLLTDPGFVNAAGADFHVLSGSGAIDTGTTIATVTTDIEGIARPQGAAYDIGAYEFTNAPPSTATATITWADVTGETEYLIEKSLDGGVTYAALKTVAANTTSTTDNQITIGTLYCYRVVARNSVGNRAASEPVCDTPGIPGRTPAPTVSFVVP